MKVLSNYNDFMSESFLDYPDNESLAVVLYMSGCNRNCSGCQNASLKEEVKYKDLDSLITELKNKCKNSRTNKLCLQGGDPLFTGNLKVTKKILDELADELDICIYTGANIDEVRSSGIKGFKYIKCGKFDKSCFVGSKKTDTYIQFATKNQQLFDEDLKLISKDGIYNF